MSTSLRCASGKRNFRASGQRQLHRASGNIQKDIEQIKVIYNLIKVRGFKIAAARKYLAANKEDAEKKTAIIEKLTNLRNELKDMKDRLNSLT